MENNELIAEEEYLFVRVIFNPNLDYNRREALLSNLTVEFSDKLILIYKKQGTELSCNTIVSKVLKYNFEELKEELERYFRNIRGCVISKKCEESCFYSPTKNINIRVAFTGKSSTFEVKGSTENLGKFLQAYSNSVQEISIGILKPVDTTSLNMNSLKKPMSLCEKIERNCWMDDDDDSLKWPELTGDSSSWSSEQSTEKSTEKSESPTQPTTEATPSNDETQAPIIYAQDTPQDTVSPPLVSTPPPIAETQISTPSTIANTATSSLNQVKPSSPASTTSSTKAQSSVTIPTNAISTILSSSNMESSESSSTHAKLDLVLQKLTKLDQISSTLDKALDKIAVLTSRLNTAETRVSSMEKTVEKIEDNYVSRAAFNELECRLNAALTDLQQKISSTTNNNSTDIDNSNTQLPPHLVELIDNRIEVLKPKSQQKSQERNSKYEPITIDEVDHDFLIVGDSNTYPIKEGIMKHGMSAAKMTTYRIEQATEAIEKLNVKRIPEKLFFHLGTNHISSFENQENDIEDIKQKFESLFKAIDKKFPDADVHLSEVLIRREQNVEKDVKTINAFLKDTCSRHKNYRLVKHSFSIDSPRYHLRDKRHLSRSGFTRFLANIRWQVLGLTPKSHYRQSNQFGHQRNRRW